MTATNAQQREYWTREGEHWVAEAERYDAMNQRFGEAMLEKAALKPGERVLDVGCGNGTTAIEAARRVGSEGSTTGIDISAPCCRSHRRGPAKPISATLTSFTTMPSRANSSRIHST